MESNINPLLKHPILQHMSYQIMKNPTLDGIKKELEKKRKTRFIFTVVTSLFFIFNAHRIFYSDSVWEFYLGLAWLLFVPLVFWLYRKEIKKYQISDEEIMQQIRIHNNWVRGTVSQSPENRH